MLGCQDFCGYYEWTFHYLRRRFGVGAVAKYWSEAIARDSQSHYIEAARREGLRGLYKKWVQTGIDEQCDWFVSLYESDNLLRLDMHHCPSKGFLIDNNRNADEDYCDHCIGWIGPALAECGIEVTSHEHNHCGQCFWEIRSQQDPQPEILAEHDIRTTSGWNRGYLDRFAHDQKLPIVDDRDATDFVEVLTDWFSNAKRLAVLGGANRDGEIYATDTDTLLIVDGELYSSGAVSNGEVGGVMLGHDPSVLPNVAKRFWEASRRPLLMHPYLPQQPLLDFATHALPRAAPVLPLLIRVGLYEHNALAKPPEPVTFGVLVAAALEKPTVVSCIADIDADLEHFQRAYRRGQGRMRFPPALSQRLNSALKSNES